MYSDREYCKHSVKLQYSISVTRISFMFIPLYYTHRRGGVGGWQDFKICNDRDMTFNFAVTGDIYLRAVTVM
jgi:hypothetical protein